MRQFTDDIGTQNGLALNSGNGGSVSFDEIRIGATFASVTPVFVDPRPQFGSLGNRLPTMPTSAFWPVRMAAPDGTV